MKLTFHHAKEKDKSIYFKNLLKEKKIPQEFWKTVKKNYLVKLGTGGHAKNFNIDGEDMNVNYLVKGDQNKIKSVISSHGIEQLIKQPTRFNS